jgi:hypothetical protein
MRSRHRHFRRHLEGRIDLGTLLLRIRRHAAETGEILSLFTACLGSLLPSLRVLTALGFRL